MTHYRSQSGMALITVLLIFAIVAVLATAMIDRQSSDIQRTGTLFALQQARAYVLGAESAVKTGLYMDWDNNKDIDHAYEEWTQERTFPLDPGTARILIQDAQGRFNLNGLSKLASNRDDQKKRFSNLLGELGVDQEFANLLFRWMDEESQEDDRYLSLEAPYRAAYRQCSHSSELLLLEGLDAEAYRKLEPYVACLPITAQLNVNTASALVLSALDDKLSLSDGEALVAARGEKGFATVDDFWGQSQLEDFTKAQSSTSGTANSSANSNSAQAAVWDKADFSVKSEYFEAFIRIELGDRIATSESLIKRDNATGEMTTLYRDYSRREARRAAEISTADNTMQTGN